MDAARPSDLQPAALAAYGGGWSARLAARVARVAGRSTLSSLVHAGPLRLQKALWPEGPDPAHLILLHPPGGIAAGDALSVDLAVCEGAGALVTTPGAGHWYRADARATQHVRLSAGPNACLEWLPQPTIVHDGARVDACLEVDVGEGATALGLEVSVLGRVASGERFSEGDSRQTLRIVHRGVLLLEDVARLAGPAAAGPAGLAGHHVSGLLWAVADRGLDDALAEVLEAAMSAHGPALWGASCVEPALLVARVVDSSPERVRHALAAAWAALRPRLFGRAAVPPRIWNT